jgi:hypothetical protein
MFRDNAEVHRLQSLKNFYLFHTDIEEECLKKFQAYCDSVPMVTSSNHTCPLSLAEIIYSALLDKWALWLDSKAPLIKQCSIEYNEHLKNEIIRSFDEFRDKHPFVDKSKNINYDLAIQWLDSPQVLLSIGIVLIHHDYGRIAAEGTFDRVIGIDREFAAEAYYYKACMRVKSFENLRKAKNEVNLSSKGPFVESVDEAIKFFHMSRTSFINRLQRKERDAAIVAQLIEKLPQNNPKTLGYASQLKSFETYVRVIIENIDVMLGAPCHPGMFVAEKEIDDGYSRKLHDLFVGMGIISPKLLAKWNLDDWQIEPFRHKYKLHRKQIEVGL